MRICRGLRQSFREGEQMKRKSFDYIALKGNIIKVNPSSPTHKMHTPLWFEESSCKMLASRRGGGGELAETIHDSKFRET